MIDNYIFLLCLILVPKLTELVVLIDYVEWNASVFQYA